MSEIRVCRPHYTTLKKARKGAEHIAEDERQGGGEEAAAVLEHPGPLEDPPALGPAAREHRRAERDLGLYCVPVQGRPSGPT